MKTSHLFKKLIILFLVLVIPLVLIASITMFNYTNKLKSETIRSYENRIQAITSSASTEFEYILRNSSSIATHSKLNKLAYTSQLMSDFERVTAINQLREYISNIKMVNPLITHIRVYVKPLLQSYNSEGYKAGSVTYLSEKEYDDLLTISQQTASQQYTNQGALKHYVLQSSTEPYYIIETVISDRELLKYFESHFVGNKFYIRFDNGYTLTNIKTTSLLDKLETETIENSGFTSLRNSAITYQVISAPISSISARCYQVIPESDLLGTIHLSFAFTIAFFLISILCIGLFFLGAVKLIHHPMLQLVHAFEALRAGDFSVRIFEENKNEFSYLFESFNNMSSHLQKLIEDDYQKNLLLQTAEFKQLQAQINPHFLYNSFFMLQRMLQRESISEAIEVSQELGSYFEYITKNYLESVNLSTEYEHARSYANIQSLRFRHRIQINLEEIPESFCDLLVPRLILQPILENGFFYGLENKVADGLLKIHFKIASENTLFIYIEDNGDELSDETISQLHQHLNDPEIKSPYSEVTGLLNIATRIKIYYKNKSSLSISRSSLGGMKVTILLERPKEANPCIAY